MRVGSRAIFLVLKYLLGIFVDVIIQELLLTQLHLLLVLGPHMIIDQSLFLLELILHLVIIVILLLPNLLDNVDLVYLSKTKCTLIGCLLNWDLGSDLFCNSLICFIVAIQIRYVCLI